MVSMYTKLYRTIFDGSLYGQFESLTVFMALLALADRHGEIDAAPAKIAGCLGCTIDFVNEGLKQLQEPDPCSRTPAEGGRRIIPLENDEGDKRPFGWKIVNYDKYRTIRNEEERRAYKRQWDRDNRGKVSDPTNKRPETTYTEGEGEANKTLMSSKLDSPVKIKNKQVKTEAREILEFLNLKTGRAYRPVDSNINMISARLKEGATLAECRKVIAKKTREWSADEKMNQYLRPATLFNAKNFAQYVGELVMPNTGYDNA